MSVISSFLGVVLGVYDVTYLMLFALDLGVLFYILDVDGTRGHDVGYVVLGLVHHLLRRLLALSHVAVHASRDDLRDYSLLLPSWLKDRLYDVAVDCKFLFQVQVVLCAVVSKSAVAAWPRVALTLLLLHVRVVLNRV